MSGPEQPLARSLLVAFRPDFAEREATARQISELILDAVSAHFRYAPPRSGRTRAGGAGGPCPATDVYAWDGAPGWDVVSPWPRLASRFLRATIVDGIGARSERTQQRASSSAGPMPRRSS